MDSMSSLDPGAIHYDMVKSMEIYSINSKFDYSATVILKFSDVPTI